MLVTAEICEAAYIEWRAKSLAILTPADLRFRDAVHAPKRHIPLFLRSLSRKVEDLQNLRSTSDEINVLRKLSSLVTQTELVDSERSAATLLRGAIGIGQSPTISLC